MWLDSRKPLYHVRNKFCHLLLVSSRNLNVYIAIYILLPNYTCIYESYVANILYLIVDIVDIINSSFQTISDDILKSYLGEANGTVDNVLHICDWI